MTTELCPHCGEELELEDVEFYQPYPSSTFLDAYYHYKCPVCGKTYQSHIEYTHHFESPIKENE